MNFQITCSTQYHYLMQLGSLIPIAQFEDHIYEQNHPENGI